MSFCWWKLKDVLPPPQTLLSLIIFIIASAEKKIKNASLFVEDTGLSNALNVHKNIKIFPGFFIATPKIKEASINDQEDGARTDQRQTRSWVLASPFSVSHRLLLFIVSDLWRLRLEMVDKIRWYMFLLFLCQCCSRLLFYLVFSLDPSLSSSTFPNVRVSPFATNNDVDCRRYLRVPLHLATNLLPS